MDPAFVLGAGCYVALQEALRPWLMDAYATSNCGGTPCWRASLVMLPQLVLMPLATMVAASKHHSLWEWCDDCEKRGLRVAARTTVYIFYAFLLLDLVYAYVMNGRPVVVLRRLMIDHHVICLLGHLYATSFCPRGSQPCFLSAITCLEVGSALCNAFWLLKGTPQAFIGALLYVVGMVISNACTIVLVWCWNVRAREAGAHLLRRWPALAVTSVLLYLRQAEVSKYVPGYGCS